MTINENVIQLCNLYLDGAINVTEILNMTYQPEMISNLNISCLHDVITTADLTVSINSENFFFSALWKYNSYIMRLHIACLKMRSGLLDFLLKKMK
jgi:hypothetical protein